MVSKTVMFGNTSLPVNCRLPCRSRAFFHGLMSERSDDGVGQPPRTKSLVANPCNIIIIYD